MIIAASVVEIFNSMYVCGMDEFFFSIYEKGDNRIKGLEKFLYYFLISLYLLQFNSKTEKDQNPIELSLSFLIETNYALVL